MKYDFDTVVDRGGNRSAKYDERMKKFGTDQVIPLWIADMDFKTAQPIVDALTARAQEGIWGYTSRPDSYFEAIRGYLEKQYHIIRWRKDSTDWLREVIMLPLMHTLSNLQTTHKKYI